MMKSVCKGECLRIFYFLVLLMPLTACMPDYGVIEENFSPTICSNDNHIHAVDLGLSVKWACCNVGAESPDEYGSYYAWGETEEKSDYSWSTYKWHNDTMTKYCTDSYCGTVDNKTTLDLSDDVAHVKWGGSWRMPTIDEFNELRSKCTWKWTFSNGMLGYKVTGPNGNSIFLPAASRRHRDDVGSRGSYGYYWSSALHSSSSYDALSLYFNNRSLRLYSHERSYGYTVRPVTDIVAVTSMSATGITETGVVFRGSLNSSGRTLTCGVIYGTTSSLSSSSGTMLSTTSSGNYTFTVSELVPNTTYYYRSFVIYAGEYKYGEVLSFKTTMSTPKAVDLGLSVKWASFNIGASFPEDYGGYYAWGETEEKSNYSWSNYKWCNGSYDSYDTMTKYCTSSSYGTVDNKTTLELSDDVAHVKWGGSWRMPTLDEIKELINDCSWSWTTQNGVNGYKVTGPNGNTIFLPAAGYRHGTVVHDRGSYGYYWSSTLNSSYSDDAHYLDFDSSSHGRVYNGRILGHTVRPVTD